MKKGFTAILVLVIILILGGIGFIAYQKFGVKLVPPASPFPTPEAIEEKDKTEGWKTYSDATYSFKYPSSWKVEPGTVQTEEYFGGDQVRIISPSPTVSIELAPKQPVYGFGPVEMRDGETFKISIDGKDYTVTESIRLDGNITKVFVDMKIPKDGKEYHILFGTGYPVNEDSKASFSEYQMYRGVILQILSSIEFCKPRPACLDSSPRCMVPETPDMCPPL